MQTSFALPAELTIYSVAELRPQWLAALADGVHSDRGDAFDADVCVVDAAAVDQVDAAGVQLLLALARTLSGQQRSLRLVHVSGPLRNACEELGVATTLLAASATEELAA